MNGLLAVIEIKGLNHFIHAAQKNQTTFKHSPFNKIHKGIYTQMMRLPIHCSKTNNYCVFFLGRENTYMMLLLSMRASLESTIGGLASQTWVGIRIIIVQYALIFLKSKDIDLPDFTKILLKN